MFAPQLECHVKNNYLCFSAPLSCEALMREERTCRQDIIAYEKKMESWSLAVQSHSKLPTAAIVKVCTLVPIVSIFSIVD